MTSISTLIIDAESGRIDRLMPNGTIRENIGSDNGYGYKRINIGGGKYDCAHRLIYSHVHGKIPEGMEIDHINGDRSDNRIENLRLVSKAQNRQNQRKAQKKNQTGILGVSQAGEKWVARISINNRKKHIGTFPTMEAAHAAYLDVKRSSHAGCTI